ncbi:MAG TPA: class I SAM-dependent methyltransferase [Acidobacteriaceae bacterium]|nr:class I SAM-dependent methyltransferase [Acidobacteriaceae bacterium]
MVRQQAEYILTRMLEAEKLLTCGEDSRQSYLSMHGARFAEIMRLCRTYVPDPSARVLDIGRSELTAHLAGFYGNVRTLGLDPGTDDGGHRELTALHAVPHITFDLLRADRLSEWPDCGPFDLIVFSEVLEHLSIAPEYTLAFLRSLLTDKGILICTTPNAAEIAKRLRMLLGRNPYQRLRLYALNPGHIREYTRLELGAIAESVGLRCLHHKYSDWLPSRKRGSMRSAGAKVLRAYPAFRRFQSIVLTR